MYGENQVAGTTPTSHPESFTIHDLRGTVQLTLTEARTRMEYLETRAKENEEERLALRQFISGCEDALGMLKKEQVRGVEREANEVKAYR